MILSDENLVLYCDGLLDAEDTARIEDILETDADARSRLAAIRRSGAALAGVGDSDLDAEAVAGLAAMVRSHRGPDRGAQTGSRTPFMRGWMQMAAALVLFVAGTVAGVVGTGIYRPDPPAMQRGWIAHVVDYQALYARATISDGSSEVVDVPAVAADLSRHFGRTLNVPDLAGAGLEFRRSQVLEFAEKPLIQLSYLPKDAGRPVALCLIASDKADMEPAYSLRRGLGVVRWVKNGVDHVLVGWQSEEQLLQAAGIAMTQLQDI